MLIIQIVVFDGFDELDVIGIYEPLRMAGLEVSLSSLSKQEVITASNGLRIIPDGVLNLAKKPDVLCVPGGGWISRAQKGAWAEAERGDILQTLKEFHRAGVILAAVCTGALLLGRAGLLKDRPVTTNHAALEELKAFGAQVQLARVVDDGDIITAGGVTSSLDLGLWLIERFIDSDKANEVAKAMEYAPRAPVWTKQAAFGIV
jgi:transcriptional regulator GlxA family with amidase domain